MGLVTKVTDVRVRVINLQTFVCGKLSAETYWVLSQPPELGDLPAPWRNDLRAAQQRRTETYLSSGTADRGAVGDAPMYVISSGLTPIAWVTLAGDVVIPGVTYSSATSRHMNLVRNALQNLSEVHLTALRRANGIEEDA